MLSTGTRWLSILIMLCLITYTLVGIVQHAAAQETSLSSAPAPKSQPQPLAFGEMTYSRSTDGGFVLGNVDAYVTIVEFADPACPHCQEYKPTIDQFISEYVMTGRAKYELRIFPTAGGQMTEYAAQLAECADRLQPGAFWQSRELLFELAESGYYDDQISAALAAELDLDENLLWDCLPTANQVYVDVDLARTVGISGTPAVLVRVGDGDPVWITTSDGTTYNRGAVPLAVLAAVVNNPDELPFVPSL